MNLWYMVEHNGNCALFFKYWNMSIHTEQPYIEWIHYMETARCFFLQFLIIIEGVNEKLTKSSSTEDEIINLYLFLLQYFSHQFNLLFHSNWQKPFLPFKKKKRSPFPSPLFSCWPQIHFQTSNCFPYVRTPGRLLHFSSSEEIFIFQPDMIDAAKRRIGSDALWNSSVCCVQIKSISSLS